MTCLKSELSGMERELHNMTEKLDNYARFKQKRQLLIASKQYQESMEGVKVKFGEMSSRNKINKLQFHQNDNLLKGLNSFRKIGSLQEYEDQIGPSKVDKLPEKIGNEDRNRVHTPLNSIYLRNIKVRTIHDEKVCNITGMKLIDPTKLALADYINCSIKIAHLQGVRSNITSYIKLKSGPWDVTSTGQNQIIATAPDINSLIFLNIGEALSVNKTINVHEKCYGIDFVDNMLIVAFTPPSIFVTMFRSVQCLDMKGHVMKTIRQSPFFIQPLINFPRYLATSQGGEYIFLPDFGSVIKLDRNGNVIDRYTCDSLNEPRSTAIAVDKDDNVYIAGRNSQNICVLNQVTKGFRPLLPFENSVAIEMCKTSDQMIVSKEGDDSVFVYQLT